MPGAGTLAKLTRSYRIVTISLMLVAQAGFGGRAMAQHAPDGSTAALAAAALGAKVVDSIMGDLTGEGRDDALLVVDRARGGMASARHPLEVVLMRREADGRPRRTAANARLLSCGPCATTGGWLRAQAGSFTVVDAGAGEMRAEYRFDYDRHARVWRITHVSRRIVDPHTGHERQQELSVRDAGGASFARFDPARLPVFDGEKNK